MAATWRRIGLWRIRGQHIDRAAVLAHIEEGARLDARYALMVTLACGIALLGLLQNSVAVIIGAMLISPLMGPIIALGMSLATFDFISMRRALKTLATGVALALAIAIWPRLMPQATLPPAGAASADDFSMLAGEEQLELYEELDFYAWLEAQPPPG